MTPTCPDCNKPMVEGFLLDVTHSNRQPVYWVTDPPEKSIWTGLKLKRKDIRRVQAYRCFKCGLLRLYANEPKS